MDTQRLILFFVFSFSILLLWEAWQKEAKAPQQIAASTAAVPPTPAPQAAAPAPSKSSVPGASAPVASSPRTDASSVATSNERIRVDTDTLRVDIDTVGGNLVYVELLRHKDANEREKNLVLLGPEHRYGLHSGLTGANLPNHTTKYTSSIKEASLAPGADTLDVRLEATSSDGVKVTKTLRFHRDSYMIDVRHEIENGSATPLLPHVYYQLVRDGNSPAGDNAMAPTYTALLLSPIWRTFKKWLSQI